MGLGRATADLDSARTKFAIVNDFTTLRNIAYQLFQGLSPSLSAIQATSRALSIESATALGVASNSACSRLCVRWH